MKALAPVSLRYPVQCTAVTVLACVVCAATKIKQTVILTVSETPVMVRVGCQRVGLHPVPWLAL